MSSFTKPCNVLNMFINFEPWKPYVLISFVPIKKTCMGPSEDVLSVFCKFALSAQGKHFKYFRGVQYSALAKSAV